MTYTPTMAKIKTHKLSTFHKGVPKLNMIMQEVLIIIPFAPSVYFLVPKTSPSKNLYEYLDFADSTLLYNSNSKCSMYVIGIHSKCQDMGNVVQTFM